MLVIRDEFWFICIERFGMSKLATTLIVCSGFTLVFELEERALLTH